MEFAFSYAWQEGGYKQADAWPWKSTVSNNFLTFSEQSIIDCTNGVTV